MDINDLWLHHCSMALPLLSFSRESPGCGELGPLGTMLKEAREREWAVCQGSDKYTGEGHSHGTSWRPQKHKWCQGLGCPRSRIYMPLKPTMFILSQCVQHLLAHTGLSLGYLAAPPATSYQLSVRRWHFGGFSSALYLIGAQHITPQSGSGSTSLKLMS